MKPTFRISAILGGMAVNLSLALVLAAPAMADASLASVSAGGSAHAGSASSVPNLIVPASVPTGYSVTGIDVSGYQTGITWSSVAASGTAFAYAKATEGSGYLNPEFSQQYNGAKSVGLRAGAYDFGRPDQRSGTSEADFFLDHAGYVRDGQTLPPMLDIEWPWSSNGTPVAPYPCYGLTTTQMVSWLTDFVSEVKLRTGQPTMIYTATSWWNQCTGSNEVISVREMCLSRTTRAKGL